MFNYIQLDNTELIFVEITLASELPNGERLFVEVENIPLVIFNIAGKLYAIGDVCTHDGGPLGDGMLEDSHVVCPRHGGEFDVRTGKAMMLPAVVDIPAYPVRVVNGRIEVGIPRQ